MAGLRIWDEFGRLVMDTSTRMGSILGHVDTGEGSGSISHPGFARGIPFWSAVGTGAQSQTVFGPRISVSGTTLSWYFRNGEGGNNANYRIIFGVI